jgi:prevent-host-death family protein
MMVMTKGTETPTLRTRRLGVAEAKSKLSGVLREAAKGPTIIHSRGRDLVVVLAIEDYERLISEQQPQETGGASFLKRVEALKQRHGGGVSDFEPARLDFVPSEPFARKRAGRA